MGVADLKSVCTKCLPIKSLVTVKDIFVSWDEWKLLKHKNLIIFLDSDNGVSEGEELYICKDCYFIIKAHFHIGYEKNTLNLSLIKSIINDDLKAIAITLLLDKDEQHNANVEFDKIVQEKVNEIPSLLPQYIKVMNLVNIIDSTLFTVDSKHNEVELFDADWNEDYGLLAIQKNSNTLEIIKNKKILDCNVQIDHPIIRWVDSHSFLLADARNEKRINNLFILDIEGKIKSSFNCGDAITDIIVSEEGIWISYFDEGIFGEGISREGLVLFNLEGIPEVKFNSHQKKGPSLLDCDAMCIGNDQSIWVVSQVDAKKYILINVNNKGEILKTYEIPAIFHQFTGIYVKKNFAYFFNGYYGNELFCFDLDNGEINNIGNLNGWVRGLKPFEKDHLISTSSSEVKIYRINE
jgi:hypothetical protein